ncbi:hypothetical protein BAE44_0020357 [Dichanthelium oligosanthes]|uniref:DUF6598 domain-containing protein n=1 Tax=Dichanthelium oligosanthes TaxID=888268 RepID=A0A1E5V0Q0_9POAL|nr:hypothetical protein BAE44_0020357 [Dichanthelium oligosanthes]
MQYIPCAAVNIFSLKIVSSDVGFLINVATRLSTVDVIYAVVKRAVEGAIAIEVRRGDFDGEITAYTTSIQNRLVLYDFKVAGDMTCDGTGAIQLYATGDICLFGGYADSCCKDW